MLLISAGTLIAQSAKISGVVKAPGGEPLADVSVKVKNSAIGTVTDADGKFSIEVPGSQSVLVFTHVGYIEKSVIAGNQKSLDVIMGESASGLSEVVVVGYGNKTSKVTLTSSISAIKGAKLIEAVPNIANKLAGRVAGILSYQTSGESGLDETTIRIRGQNTTGNAAPLVIIDGVPGRMSDINSEDVEDISILKDAAAVAPYGLAAGNGVILMTTKRGVKGGAKFSYNANYGVQNPVWLTKTLNSYQQALMQNEIYLNDHANDPNVPWSASELEEYRKVSVGDPTGNYDKYFNSNNLHDVIRHDYPISNQHFSVRGGSDNITYYASLGYFNQASMIPNENFKKYYGVVNLDADLNKTLKVSLSVRMDRGSRVWPSFGNQITEQFGIYGRMYEIAPDDAIRYPNTDGF